MIGIIPALSALVGFLVSWLLGLPVIPMLKRLKFGQTIREDGPDWHKTKQGTPTMGGVLIVIGLAVAVCFGFGVSLFFNEGFMLQLNTSVEFTKIFAGLGLAIGMGLIGFFDDYIKVVKKRNLGLTAWQKTLFQSLVTAG